MAEARTSRADSKAATRARLLRAAAALVAEKGYRAASLDEIANRAGLTKGAVYSNFTSKDDLFFALLDELAGGPDMSAFADDTLPLVDQLRAFATGLARQAASPEMRFQFPLELEFSLLAIRDDRASERARAQQKLGRRHLAAWLELRATETGVGLPLPADQLATALTALLRGLLQQHYFEPDAVSSDLFADAVTLLLGAPTPGRTTDSDGGPA